MTVELMKEHVKKNDRFQVYENFWCFIADEKDYEFDNHIEIKQTKGIRKK